MVSECVQVHQVMLSDFLQAHMFLEPELVDVFVADMNLVPNRIKTDSKLNRTSHLIYSCRVMCSARI